MRWVILPVGQLEECSDTFRAGRVLVRLRGHCLDVEANDAMATESELKALAGRYIEALRTAGVFISRWVSETEYGQLPPWATNASGGVIRGPNRSERERLQRAVRSARHTILGSDATVIRAYDYLEDAVDGKSIRLSPIYKAIETIEHELGGEARTLKTLGVKYKFAKQLASNYEHDERHAPKPTTLIAPVPPEDRDRAFTVARTLVEAFVNWRQAAKDAHNHTPDEEHRIREAALDETVAGSFPASAPPSSRPNPDEHDAGGSGVEPAEDSRLRASRADIVMTEDPGKKSKKASAPASSRSTKKRTTAPAQVAHGEVARRAYDLFLARECEHGHDLDDWLQAERELRGTPSSTTRRARKSSRQVSRKTEVA